MRRGEEKEESPLAVTLSKGLENKRRGDGGESEMVERKRRENGRKMTTATSEERERETRWAKWSVGTIQSQRD